MTTTTTTMTAITSTIERPQTVVQRATVIAVSMAGGRARIDRLEQGHFLAARPLHSSGRRIRLALVGLRLGLLGGDAIEITVSVGAGAELEIVEPSGMVAYNSGGRGSSWRLSADIGEGGTLVWRGATFVAAAGSNTIRSSVIHLQDRARALVSETLIFGRSGETGIALTSGALVTHLGEELLVENLAVRAGDRAVGITGGARVLASVLALGFRPSGDTTEPRWLQLAGAGAVWRALAPAAHLVEEQVERQFGDWRRQIFAEQRQ
jgi:urease accessory protein